MKNKGIIISVIGGVLLLFIFFIFLSSGNKENNSKATQQKAQSKSSKIDYGTEVFDAMKSLSQNGKSTDDIYITGALKINKDSKVVPGVYDIEVTGGSGNINAERSTSAAPFINFVAGIESQDSQYPSKIRLILLNNDVLKFRNISKVKFIAVNKFEEKTELSQGEFVVGLDIPQGKYKLSTNVVVDPQFDNLGWTIETTRDDQVQNSQNLNNNSKDVVVDLKKGDVISLSNSYTGQTDNVKPNDEKLIFNKVK